MFNLTTTTMTLSQISVSATPTQQAIISAAIKPGGTLAAQFVGLPASQIAAILNQSVNQPNPFAESQWMVTQVPRSAVQNIITSILFALESASPQNTALITKYTFINNQVNAYADPSYPVADVQPYLATALSDGLMSQAQAEEALSSIGQAPDVVPVGTWALLNLGAYIEASDVTAVTGIS